MEGSRQAARDPIGCFWRTAEDRSRSRRILGGGCPGLEGSRSPLASLTNTSPPTSHRRWARCPCACLCGQLCTAGFGDGGVWYTKHG